METGLNQIRAHIGPTVRRLRKERRWTLGELGRRLDLSESRLSEVERGQGSFSAEQLLLLFQLFHVGPADFVEPDAGRDPVVGSLQNALARLGASHLVADEAFVIRREHERPIDLLLDVLIVHPTARALTALPPVLVRHEVSLPAVQHGVVQAGVPGRLGWLLEHALAALDAVDGGSVGWRRESRRWATVAGSFLSRVVKPAGDVPWDLLDAELRSPIGVAAAEADATKIDRRWRVISRLTTADFVGPLEVARDAL